MFKIHSLPSVTAFYLDVAYQIRKIRGCESAYFMPNEDNNMHYLIKAEEAEAFCIRMFQRYKLPKELIDESMEKFDRIVKTDLAIRIVHNRATKIDENEKNKFISFDSLMEFVAA